MESVVLFLTLEKRLWAIGAIRGRSKLRKPKDLRCLSYVSIILFIFIFNGSIPSFASNRASSGNACFQIFTHFSLSWIRHQDSSQQKIETLDELLYAFAHGFLPDLSNASHRDAFEIYRHLRFGDPDTNLKKDSLDEVAEILTKHPELEKEPFRNFKFVVDERNYPVTEALASFLDSQVTAAAQVRSNLFRIEANTGFWKKVLQYTDVEFKEQLARDATDEQKKTFREKSKLFKKELIEKWQSFLDSKLPPSLRSELLNSTDSPTKGALALYNILHSERERMIEAGYEIRPISQAMIDLVHTIGYFNSVTALALKSQNGMERIEGYRKILNERDLFAMELGYADHFDQLMNEIGVPAGVIVPSGVPSSVSIAETLNELEEGVIAGSERINSQSEETESRTIRHLSLIESPFRSCIGGSDCSSRTYLSLALDPNYHYFTISDKTGHSSGQITVVLGEGERGGHDQREVDHKKLRVAFLDKVQNVPNSDLAVMIEGVRRSFEEKGYTLIIPDDVGTHNGLSNEESTRRFVKEKIQTNEDEPIINFSPFSHSYEFPNQYSRADQKLASHVVARLNLSKERDLSPDELTLPWKLRKVGEGKSEDLDLRRLAQASIRLKNSRSLEDRLKYIPAMKVIRDAGLKIDSNFESTLVRWMDDPHESFQLRKQALIFQWKENLKPLSRLLMYFSRNEQIQIIQNLIDTPRYERKIQTSITNLPYLMMITRENTKVRNILVGYFTRRKIRVIRPLIERVLDAQDLPDSNVVDLIKSIETAFIKNDLKQIVQLQKFVQESKIDSEFKDDLATAYALHLNGEMNLGRTLWKCFYSQDQLARQFGERLLTKVSELKIESNSKLKIVEAYRDILSFWREKYRFRSLSQAALNWIQSEEVNPELKVSFLFTVFGSQVSEKEKFFEYYLRAIPNSQLLLVQKNIDEVSFLKVFQNEGLTQEVTQRFSVRSLLRGFKNWIETSVKSSSLSTLAEYGKIESFQFRSIKFPDGGQRVQHGSLSGEIGGDFDESIHEVTLTKDFEIQSTLVTQLQWAWVMGENPSAFRLKGSMIQILGKLILMFPNRPVEMVSWNDVQEFIRKLNNLDPDYDYRLPTEAEWEYAARAGTTHVYSFGEDSNELEDYGWHFVNSRNRTHDVASLRSNLSGLYDIHGNVSEWVQNRYQRVRPQHAVDPIGPEDGLRRVVRGGGWDDYRKYQRISARRSYEPDTHRNDLGFRLVRTRKAPVI